MFKKSLAVLAVLGAFAGVSSAAEVTLYGRVDAGLQYQHIDQDEANVDDDDNFAMKSGFTTGSRWGMKGTEDLGNGMTVGFVLENGFNVDDGSLGDSDRLFNRESQVFVRSNFGELSFGRVGQLNSGNGTYGLTGSISPFGTTWGDYSGNSSNFMSGGARFDNTVTYKSPAFAGFNVYAQYSFDGNSQAENDRDTGAHGTEGKSSVDRYYGIGATYKNGNVNMVLVVDSTNYSTKFYGEDVDDSLVVTLGGSHDLGVVKPYIGVQYFDNADMSSIGIVDSFSDVSRGDDFAEGWGLTIGADIPLFGGTAKIGASYIDADYESYESKDLTGDFSAWALTAGYKYNLSKRTYVYGALSYASLKDNDDAKNEETKPSAVEGAIGLVHMF